MAKSIRSKAKRSFRAKKRTEGIYAATEAGRLHRLNSKIRAHISSQLPESLEEDSRDAGEEDSIEEVQTEGNQPSTQKQGPSVTDTMDVDPTTSSSQRINTHGPRDSRRESWRASKGLVPRPRQRGMNHQGGVAAKRNAGRPHRRR